MKVYFILAIVAIVAIVFINLLIFKEEPTLVFVNVFFRDGDRTLAKPVTYKYDPYRNMSYYPSEVGHMTMQGKRRMYKVGQELRNRYDALLGDVYSKHLIYAVSSNVPRTEESMQVVLAGLFPPIQEYIVEEGLNWQPVMYDTIKFSDDDMLAFWGKCTEYFDRMDELILNSEHAKNVNNRYEKFYEYLTEHSGENVTNLVMARFLYDVFSIQASLGLELPEWTKNVYPEPLRKISKDFFAGLAAQPQAIKYSAGRLLKEVSTSFRQKATSKIHQDHKMNLFAGHEYGIHGVLAALNIKSDMEVPFGAYLMLELHNVKGSFVVKVYYQDHSSADPVLKIIANCESLCSLADFVALTKKYYPNPNVCLS